MESHATSGRKEKRRSLYFLVRKKKDWRGKFNRNATSAIQIEKKKIIFKNKLPLAILYLDI
jgi:hypothetical protein